MGKPTAQSEKNRSSFSAINHRSVTCHSYQPHTEIQHVGNKPHLGTVLHAKILHGHVAHHNPRCNHILVAIVPIPGTIVCHTKDVLIHCLIQPLQIVPAVDLLYPVFRPRTILLQAKSIKYIILGCKYIRLCSHGLYSSVV